VKSADAMPSIYEFQLSGQTGVTDYTFENTYLGRYEGEGFLSHQFQPIDGGFTTASPFSSASWMTALNMTASIPGLPKRLDIKVYGNIAKFGEMNGSMLSTVLESFAWECGLQYSILNSAITIYVPLTSSSQLKDFSDAMDYRFADRIRFSINLNAVNPFKLISSAF